MAAFPFRRGAPGAVAVASPAPEPILPVMQAAMEEGVREALRAKTLSTSLTVVESEQASVRLSRVAYAPEAARIREVARTKIAEAYDAYFTLDLPRARRALADASGALERSPQMPEDLALLSDVSLLTGIIALNSDPRNANDAFDLVLRLTPDRTLDPNRFPPYAVSALKAAKERFDLLPTTQVNVETDPADAWIALDGASRGRTPLTLDRLPTGAHFYRVEKAQLKPLFGRIEFHAGVVEPLSLHLEPVRETDLEAPIAAAENAAPAAPGVALARLLSLDRVFLGGVALDGPRRYSVTVWWADASGKNSWPLTRSVSAEPSEFAREVVAMVREVAALSPSDSREPLVDGNALARDVSRLAAGSIKGTLAPPPPEWYRRRGVIAGAAGGVFLTLLITVIAVSAQPGKVNVDMTVPTGSGQ